MAIMTVNDLYKNYGDVRALQGINLEVNKGEVYGFIGRGVKPLCL